MSPRNRRRRDTNAPRPELSRQDRQRKRGTPTSSLAGTGIPDWNWRTTPVLFAFAVGGLAGTYLGLGAAIASNLWAFIVIQGAFALLFGAALGRVVRRWLAIRRVERIRAGG